MESFEGDIQYEAEGDLLNLTERLCEIDGKQGLTFRILLNIIEFCARRIIYKKG